jgi:hypothetical protein
VKYHISDAAIRKIYDEITLTSPASRNIRGSYRKHHRKPWSDNNRNRFRHIRGYPSQKRAQNTSEQQQNIDHFDSVSVINADIRMPEPPMEEIPRVELSISPVNENIYEQLDNLEELPENEQIEEHEVNAAVEPEEPEDINIVSICFRF